MTSAETNSGGGSATVAAVGGSHHSSTNSVPEGRNSNISTNSKEPNTNTNTTTNGINNDETETSSAHTRRPADHALKQQRMKSWQPLLDPKWVIATYLLIAIIFVPSGIVIRNKSNDLIELHSIYESHLTKGPPADLTGCEIYNSPNKMYKNDPPQYCQFQMQVPFDKGDMEPPVLVHYELYNFYQNYRKYVISFDSHQLLGSTEQHTTLGGECEPLLTIGDIKINPCGLIANTLFNDVISLVSIVDPNGNVIENAPLVEEGIAWRSDLEWKYKQPNGFRFEQCASCDENDCDCSEVDGAGERVWSCKTMYENEDGVCFRFFYPDDDITQYLYETYPMVVNPLEGVMNEHFVVWMRTAALPHFRKLYGYIEQTIPAGSVLTFKIQANYAVQRNKGAKALVVSNSYRFGGKNHWLGTLFIAVGGIAGVLGVLFLAKDVLAPRKLGDKMYLKFKED